MEGQLIKSCKTDLSVNRNYIKLNSQFHDVIFETL